ncbi:hypothetical protein RY654_003236 [Escherichia coli]|nr:hypothetical protein [Escherichia coli]
MASRVHDEGLCQRVVVRLHDVGDLTHLVSHDGTLADERGLTVAALIPGEGHQFGSSPDVGGNSEFTLYDAISVGG